MQLAWGFVPPLGIEAAIRNRVFDVLDGGPKTVQQVGELTGASVRGLTALMDMLVGLELLAKTSGGQYELTPESAAFLVSTKPSFQGGFLRHTSGQLVPRYLSLSEIVRTGKPAASVNQESEGAEFFQNFVEDIMPMSFPAARVLAETLGVARATKPLSVLDLAAGSGVWSIALAQASPQVRVTAVDWANVIPVTRRTTARFGVGDRYMFVAGDLLQADFGTGHAIATLGYILHSEGEQRSRALLKKTFQALAPGGTIAIAEFLVNDERTEPVGGLIFALNMIVNTAEGNTYSFNEIASWLKDAGFGNARTVEAPGPSPLILADKL
jgi:ubiquinone/menaquinone biosynthesis C-methylase UbiE